MREPRAAASAVRSRAGWVEPLHQKAALPSLAASVRATRSTSQRALVTSATAYAANIGEQGGAVVDR